MAWSKEEIKVPNMVFEICNFLFNYAILNTNQAVMFLKEKQGVEQYKNCLQKLQYVHIINQAVWAVQEMVRYNQQLQNTMKIPLEYQSSSLEFLNAFLSGTAYLCILEILKQGGQGKMSEEDFASLDQEISKNFFIVRDIIKSNNALKKIFSYLNEDIASRYYDHGISALVRMAKVFEAKHHEAKSKGFNGIQLAYLREAQNLINYASKESFADQKMILNKYSFIPKLIEDATLLNNEVFKAAIPPRDQLTHIKPIEQKVRPIEPKNVRIPPKDIEYFKNFKSEEMETVRTSLQLFISNKREHVDKTLFDLKENLNEMGKAYNIPFLKVCTNINEVILNDEFKKKVTKIREIGDKGYQDLVSQVQHFKQVIDNGFKHIDSIVDQEIQKDKQALATLQNGNYTTFVAAFNDQITNVNSLKSSYRNYRAIEERILSSFDQFKSILPKLGDRNVDMQELLKVPDLDQFITQNKESLLQLKKLAEGLDTLINKYLGEQQKTITEALNSIDVEGSSQKVLMNEKSLDEIFHGINEKINPLLTSFEEKANQVLVPMGKIKDLGSKLQTSNPGIVHNNPLTFVLLSVDFFYVKFAHLGISY